MKKIKPKKQKPITPKPLPKPEESEQTFELQAFWPKKLVKDLMDYTNSEFTTKIEDGVKYTFRDGVLISQEYV